LVIALASLDPGPFFTFPPARFSLYWYRQFLGDPSWRNSLYLTLTIALLTGLAATLIGGLAGIGVARSSPRVRRFLYPVLVAPLAVPVIVLAISFYGVVLRLHIVGSLGAFVAANTLLTVPLVALLTVSAALGVDRRLEYASLACGAGPWRTLFRITLPLIAPTAIAGGALSFLLTLDEVVMSIFLVAPERTPLAVRLFEQIRTGTPPLVEAAATFLIAVSIVVVGTLTVARSVVAARGSNIRLEAPPLDPEGTADTAA
jgi:ABC-type spermidine/putrescine transport system permease subunit II